MTYPHFTRYRFSCLTLAAMTWAGAALVAVGGSAGFAWAQQDQAQQEEEKPKTEEGVQGKVRVNPTPGMKPPKVRTIKRFGEIADEPTGPRNFEFDPPSLDLGIVGVDVEVRREFTVRNISDEPLTIVAMKPDCKCTTIEDLTGRVIPAGESVTVTAVVESRPVAGRRTSRIRFVFSDYGATQYEITTEAARAVETSPDFLSPAAQMWGELVVSARDGKPFRILGANGEPPTFLDDFEPTVDQPRTAYRIRWDLSRYDPEVCLDEDGNAMPRWYVIETDHPSAPIAEVRIQHYCARVEYPDPEQNWVLSRHYMVLGVLKPNEPVEFEIGMNWFRKTEPDDIIHSVESESLEQFTAEIVEVTTDADDFSLWRIRVTPMPGQQGLVYGRMRFYAEHADYGLTVIGRIE